METVNEATDNSSPIGEDETAYEEGIADTNNSKFAEDIKHSADTRTDPSETDAADEAANDSSSDVE